MAKAAALSEGDYLEIGRRWGSDDVSREAKEVLGRWTRDLAALAAYGYGAKALAAFQAELARHDGLRAARHEAVAIKTVAVSSHRDARRDAANWVGKVTSLLGPLARENGELAAKLNEAEPATDAHLDASVGALAKLLESHGAELPEDAEVQERLSEVEAIRGALNTAPATAAVAKTQPATDTAELNRSDGKLYVVMRDLNAAARRAIGAGALAAQRSEYVFKYLRRGTAKKSPPPGVPPA